MKYYVFNDEVYIKADELIDFASKENNNKIEVKGRVYTSPVCCKDCKYWVKDFSSIEEHEIFSYLKETCVRSGICKEIPMSADDFCSRGEKR